MKTNPAARDIVELDLFRRSVKGDMPAFKKLYALTCRQVYAYLCRMLIVRTIADIALVETYSEVAKSAAHYKGSMKVSTWIMSIARAIALHKLGQPQVKKAIEKQLVNTQTKISLDSMNKQRMLHQTLYTLPLQHREILSLALLPKSTYEDMAKIFRSPVATVKSSVFQSKDEFEKNLISVGIKS